MDQLKLRCRGLHVLDIVKLTSEMLTYYGDAEGVPEYINIIKGAHKKGSMGATPRPQCNPCGYCHIIHTICPNLYPCGEGMGKEAPRK